MKILVPFYFEVEGAASTLDKPSSLYVKVKSNLPAVPPIASARAFCDAAGIGRLLEPSSPAFVPLDSTPLTTTVASEAGVLPAAAFLGVYTTLSPSLDPVRYADCASA